MNKHKLMNESINEIFIFYIKNLSICQVLVFITLVMKEDNAMLHAWKPTHCNLYH